jgi:single-strand DNA-binding protein
MAVNNVFLMGRLVRDPDVRYASTGLAVTSFTLAVDRPVSKKGANANAQTADFIDCVSFGKLAEVIGNSLSKGKRALIQGSLHMDSYTDKEGKKRIAPKVSVANLTFIDSNNNRNTGNAGGANGNAAAEPFSGMGDAVPDIEF